MCARSKADVATALQRLRSFVRAGGAPVRVCIAIPRRPSVTMTLRSSKFQVHSSKTVPHVIAVEPWGADYTLLPGESLEVTAFGDETTPSFELVAWDDSSQVYCNDASTYEVTQNGVAIPCGHNRQSEGASNA